MLASHASSHSTAHSWTLTSHWSRVLAWDRLYQYHYRLPKTPSESRSACPLLATLRGSLGPCWQRQLDAEFATPHAFGAVVAVGRRSVNRRTLPVQSLLQILTHAELADLLWMSQKQRTSLSLLPNELAILCTNASWFWLPLYARIWLVPNMIAAVITTAPMGGLVVFSSCFLSLRLLLETDYTTLLRETEEYSTNLLGE